MRTLSSAATVAYSDRYRASGSNAIWQDGCSKQIAKSCRSNQKGAYA